ncbi:hypothetical protein KKG31_02770 [Patescibacteria group bacterium]|nr:hypothetical protein [Patescibacteria group bacterium]MBU1758084.1 hypothetical protein [Patescibacteria group bacterium]
MRKFWLFAIVLGVLILGYQWMQYNENHRDIQETDIMTGIAGRYSSDALHLEFDYPDGVTFQET